LGKFIQIEGQNTERKIKPRLTFQHFWQADNIMANETEANDIKGGNATNKTNTKKREDADKENRGYAAIGLGIMCLATLITHAVLNAPNSKPSPIPKPRGQNQGDPILVFKVISISFMLILWAVGLNLWVTYLAEVSVTLRNRSIIGGLFAANAGLAYTLLWNSSASLQEYIGRTLWPTYLAIVLGVVM
jgi:hypothetical protein